MPESPVILALAFGVGRIINFSLKRKVEALALALGDCPVFTQDDLGSILSLKSVRAKQPGAHISSLAIIEQFARVAKMNGWNCVHLVAAKQHTRRCARDLRRIMPQAKVVLTPVRTPYCHDRWWWVRSPLVW